LSDKKQYLTTGQAAEMLSVTPDAVLKWIKAGRIRAMRTPGGHYRINRSEILQKTDVHNTLIKRANGSGNGNGHGNGNRYSTVQYCWEFNANVDGIDPKCRQCIVYQAKAYRCYEMIKLPENSGHARSFCNQTCEECEYYHTVKTQPPNVMVVTDKKSLQNEVVSKGIDPRFDVSFVDCEYTFSMIVEKFRPDYVTIDCSMGNKRAREFAMNIAEDPRLPYVRIVLVGDRFEIPSECDKAVFACIEGAFTMDKFNYLINNLELISTENDLKIEL